MSYLQYDNENAANDLLRRKEFFSLKMDPERNFRRQAVDELEGKYLKIHSHQLFNRNYMNPNTKNMRVHVNHSTGSGKTLLAVTVADSFAKVYKNLYAVAAAKMQAGRRNYGELDQSTPSIFVLGFGGTKAAFIRELLKHPEFGFITPLEKEELLKRQKIADAGLVGDIKHLKEFTTQIKKRITNKTKGGFYKFYGYDEFVNRLFITNDVKLTDLEILAAQKLRAGENITLEDVIYAHIKSGVIQINNDLLVMFKNSILICDEIHNTYNMNMKNNRGVAVQFLLDSVPNLRFLSLSATPLNNSPTEIIELINYLVPKQEKVTKRAFFASSRLLFPGKLKEIGRLMQGKVSFLQDVDANYFPKRVFMGHKLTIPTAMGDFSAGSYIPYLKFITCEMSKFHQTTYQRMVSESSSSTGSTGSTGSTDSIGKSADKATGKGVGYKAKAEVDIAEELEAIDTVNLAYINEEHHAVPTDGYSIYDLAFPNPESNEYGLFRSSDVRNKITSAPHAWKDANGIMIKKYSATNSLITGPFMERDNIGKYCKKAETLLDMIMEIILSSAGDINKCQKIMISHYWVKMSGVLFIQELLKINGCLDEYGEPTDATICCICGKRLDEHNAANAPAEGLPLMGVPGGKSAELPPVVNLAGSLLSPHSYKPVRFVLAHSDIDKLIMNQSLAKFNADDNFRGTNFMILVGSKIIKESYDFKAIRHLFIMSLPINIPTLLQVLGRSIRKHSHVTLPPEDRTVSIYILISIMQNNTSPSPEMYKYIEKLSDYMVIQSIEREYNSTAIDAAINRDINMQPAQLAEYFPHIVNPDPNAVIADPPVGVLGNLYFDPTFSPNYNLEDLELSTFTAYKYYEEEIKTISYIIKRLFIQQPVWCYDDLLAAVRAPPFGLEVNPKLFQETNYIIALSNLVISTTTIIASTKAVISETMLIERLFDYSERYIYIGGHKHKIEQIDKYYILFPISDQLVNPLNIIHAEYSEHIRDKERAMIKSRPEPNNRVLIDVETYLRPLNKLSGFNISIDMFVSESKTGINYTIKKDKFMAEYEQTGELKGFLFDYSAAFQMMFIEEAIVAVAAQGIGNIKPIFSAVIALLGDFRVIISRREVAKYRDTVKLYQQGLPDGTDDTPLGYMTAKSVRLYDLHALAWFEVSKIALNRHASYKENDIIIGYLESAEDYMRFKLRKPIQVIKQDMTRELARIRRLEKDGNFARTSVNDTRLIERGIVCSTKNKRDLIHIIASLGVSISKMDRSEIRIKVLCRIIKDKLIANEIKERGRDSNYKYLYSWWDENIDLGARL